MSYSNLALAVGAGWCATAHAQHKAAFLSAVSRATVQRVVVGTLSQLIDRPFNQIGNKYTPFICSF
jgi:hypothetical protein